MRKIFLPTDFSDIAHNAAHLAVQVAQKANAKVFLFHLLNIPLDWERLTVEQEKNYPEVKALIANTKLKLSAYAQSDIFKNVEVEWEVFINDTVENVVKHADAVQSDLIVMGTHGSKGFNELVLGSNTQKVVRYAKAPVLTVHKLHKPYKLRHIALFADFNKDDNYLDLFNHTLALANLFDATVHIVKVLTPSNDFLEFDAAELEAFIDNKVVRKDAVRIDYLRPVEDGIFEYLNTHKIDMVVMGTHGRTGISRLLMGSVAEVVVNHSPVPVMVSRVSQ